MCVCTLLVQAKASKLVYLCAVLYQATKVNMFTGSRQQEQHGMWDTHQTCSGRKQARRDSPSAITVPGNANNSTRQDEHARLSGVGTPYTPLWTSLKDVVLEGTLTIGAAARAATAAVAVLLLNAVVPAPSNRHSLGKVGGRGGERGTITI